ncbi:MAG: hypothetical protein V1928_03680 [Parcubacteria group bacterium]
MAEKKNSGWFGRNLGIFVFAFLGLILSASIWLILKNSIASRPAEDDSLIDRLSAGSAAPVAVETQTAGEKSYGRFQAKVAELIEAYIRANLENDLLKPNEECVEIRMTLQLDTPGGKPDKEEYYVRYQLTTGKIFFYNSADFPHCADKRAVK